jgi:hypothetical protein
VGLGNYWNRFGGRHCERPTKFAVVANTGVGYRRPTKLETEAAVSRPPLLVHARWEKDEAGLRQPIEKKGGTSLNTNALSGAECGWSLNACKDKSSCFG